MGQNRDYVARRQKQKHSKINVTDTLSAGIINVSSMAVTTMTATTLTGTTINATTLNGANTYRGITTVLSGTDTITVSVAAMAATSGYPILVSGYTDVASDRQIAWSVASVVDNTSFEVYGSATTARDVTIGWLIIK